MSQQSHAYLLAGQHSELERLQLQSRVWEPAARAVLAQLPACAGRRALEVGCGVTGWLRVLSRWVGPTGHVVARFQIAPLGRAKEQLAAYTRLLHPGGILVLEDPDMASWRVNPEAPAVQRLIALIEQGFIAAGGNFNAGRELPSLLSDADIEPRVSAHVVALEPGHSYLRLPIQFAASLRPRLEPLLPGNDLDELIEQAERELARPGTWGTTFTLVQAFGALPDEA